VHEDGNIRVVMRRALVKPRNIIKKREVKELKKCEDMLFRCIEDINAGRSSIEDCLDRYLPVREQLEPLLRIALEIRNRRDRRVEVTGSKWSSCELR